MKNGEQKIYAQNKKAHYDYFIEETIEAGIVLTGTEIKSVRKGKANLSDGYVQIRNGEAFLFNVHISSFENGNQFNVEPTRTRKLLMHKKEIMKWYGYIKEQGYTIVPIKMYPVDGYCKVLIGIAKGKKNYNKRQTIAKKDADRDIQRALKNINK